MSHASPRKPQPTPDVFISNQHEPGHSKLRVKIEQFESVLKLRDTHPFGPKGAFARWLDEFSEMEDHGTCPPPMA